MPLIVRRYLNLQANTFLVVLSFYRVTPQQSEVLAIAICSCSVSLTAAKQRKLFQHNSSFFTLIIVAKFQLDRPQWARALYGI